MNNEIYNFDCVVDRHDTYATKFEEMDRKFGRHDLLPFWIADMDFQACPAIIDALRNRLNHTVLGYTTPPDEFWSSITTWLARRHGWHVANNEVTFMPGLKKALSLCINYFSRPGDAVVIQPPVYHSFRSVIEGNGRRVADNPLIRDAAGRYKMDIEGLIQVIHAERPTMMIVCNPHNPIGLQWDADTLSRVAEVCRDNGVVLVSDEIYGDMMLGGRRHIPTASVSPVAKDITITLGAPSKTFNIPGIVSAWAVVRSPEVREPFFNWLTASEFNAPPIAAMVATQAAYENGGEWLDQALKYLQDNVNFAAEYCDRHIPGVKLYRPEASFTVWLDFNELGLSREALVKLLVERGHLALSEGSTFGNEGYGFMRMNIGVPRTILESGLSNLATAVSSLHADEKAFTGGNITNIPFVKMNGLGNNFVYVDCMERPIDNPSELARQISRRHTGVGADGIIAILPGDKADCRMRIFNADGSEAQMCGNGIRCVAKYIYDNRLVSDTRITIETLSGVKTVEVHPGIDGLTDTVTVDMGAPKFMVEDVPVNFDGAIMVNVPVKVENRELGVTAVSMGNPHGVVFVDNFDNDIVSTVGPVLETHEIWPEKANIEFVRVDDLHTLSMRAWERGAGETMACGTGACAAAAAAVATGRAKWPVTMRLIGGNLVIDKADNGNILMTGPAVTEYAGTYYQSSSPVD
ncbi:MAG: diaminopimelate epimerase [Muribaculaceae bacterium]|nr:diaminopimelate epimerase [Muribaculaceae bacterium]